MDRIVHLWWRILEVKGTQNTQDCQKLKFYQIQINWNSNQCFPKQFWCWSWRNGLDYNNIPFFVVYGKSPQGITQSRTSPSQPPTAMLFQRLGRRELRLRLCNSLCRTELILLAQHWKGGLERNFNNFLINGVDVILNLIFLFQNITSMLKNFQVALDVTILHQFAY